MDAIVEAVKQPYKLQKDVAQQYRIAPHLVCKLVKEAKNAPEK